MAYNLSQDDFRKFTEDVLGANGDQATLTTILADMQDTVFNGIGQIEKLTKTTDDLDKENARLRSANMELFLRIGDSNKESSKQTETQKEPLSTSEYMEKYFDKLEGK